MAFILSLLGNQLVMRIGLQLLDSFLASSKADKESKQKFAEFCALMRSKGVIDSKLILKAEDQISSGNAIWDERDKNGSHL